MVIEKLSHSTLASASVLCSLLREHDEHPCSFWGYSLEELQSLIGNTEKLVFVSVVQGNVIGVGTLSKGGRFQDHWAEISIAVHPSFRKVGAGKGLALKFEEVGKEMGLDFIKAMILENNANSRRFFSGIGYEHKATLFHDFKLETFGPLNDCAYYKVLSLSKKGSL